MKIKKTRKYFLIFILIILFFTGLCSFRKSPPNIIIVMADTLRADYLGCYGFKGDISPHIDAMAEESILFERCFTQAPWTKPAIASLFTSMLPRTHGVVNHPEDFWVKGNIIKNTGIDMQTAVLAEEALTLAEALQETGYQTAGFVANPWINEAHGFGQGFDFFGVAPGRLRYADRTFAPVRTWLNVIDEDRPFFLYLHFMDTHGPYQCAEQDLPSFPNTPPSGADTELGQQDWIKIDPYLRNSCSDCAPGTMRKVSNWRACYAAGVMKFDKRLGDILHELREGGFLHNSILVFLSDHGEELYEHGGWNHGFSLYQHQLHIPLLIRLPRGKNAGKRVARVTNLVDVLPTLLHFAKAKTENQKWMGQDLSGLINGNKADWSPYSIAEAVRHKPHLISIQNAKSKLIMDLKDKTKLRFNLKEDPQEKKIPPKGKEGLWRRLETALLKILDGLHNAGNLTKKTAPLTDETKEALRSLGYLQ